MQKRGLMGNLPLNRHKLPHLTLPLYMETKRQPYVYGGTRKQYFACRPLASNAPQELPVLGSPRLAQRNVRAVHVRGLSPPSAHPGVQEEPHTGPFFGTTHQV